MAQAIYFTVYYKGKYTQTKVSILESKKNPCKLIDSKTYFIEHEKGKWFTNDRASGL